MLSLFRRLPSPLSSDSLSSRKLRRQLRPGTAQQKTKNDQTRARTFLASFFSSECDGIDDRSRSMATQSALASRFDASSWQALLAWTCSAVSSSSNPKWSTITFVGGGGMANVETSSSPQRCRRRRSFEKKKIFRACFTLSLDKTFSSSSALLLVLSSKQRECCELLPPHRRRLRRCLRRRRR